MDRVVARFTDGHLVKGMTGDFFRTKDVFHVNVTSPKGEVTRVEIHTKELKALFFVKDFIGNPQHVESNMFGLLRPPKGRRISVTFSDGEVLVGTTVGYRSDLPGFFLVPADTDSNIERCYVIVAATQEVDLL